MRRAMIPVLVCVPWLMAVRCGMPSFESEEGQWSFTDTGLVAVPEEGLDDDQSVLPDERVCPRDVNWSSERPDEWSDAAIFAACVEEGLEGPASFEQRGDLRCIAMEGVGEVSWLLEPVACDVPFVEGEEPISDRVVFDVADPEAVSAHVLQWAEIHALSGLELSPVDALTEDDLLMPGETLYVLADAPVRLYVQLWDGDREQPTAWRAQEGEVRYTATGSSWAVREDLLEGIAPRDGWIAIELGVGDQMDLGVDVRGQRFDGAIVEAVPASSLASIELVAAYGDFFFAEEGTIPYAARAIVRDDQGRQVFGVPVEWRVSGGRLAVEPGLAGSGDLMGDDYAWLEDACRHPKRAYQGERSAVLHASYEDLSDSLELSWSYPEGWMDAYEDDELDEMWADFEPSPYCIGAGCNGCSSTGSGAGAAWVLGLLGLALGLRRRRD
jgi:uncharacterized protein (TIGR03382 family)